MQIEIHIIFIKLPSVTASIKTSLMLMLDFGYIFLTTSTWPCSAAIAVDIKSKMNERKQKLITMVYGCYYLTKIKSSFQGASPYWHVFHAYMHWTCIFEDEHCQWCHLSCLSSDVINHYKLFWENMSQKSILKNHHNAKSSFLHKQW